MRASDRPSQTSSNVREILEGESRTEANLHFLYGAGTVKLDVRPSPDFYEPQ